MTTEPRTSPPDRENASLESENTVRWYVLHVHPRCEKKLAEFCRLQTYDHYLPLRSETKIYQRRKVTVEKPVFPGYIFTAFDDHGRVEILKTNNVVRILATGNEPRLLREIDQIRKALLVDPTLTATLGLATGTQVRITGGPFMGIEGVVREIKGTAKVMLNVDLIGQAVAVEVERGLIEVMD